MNHAAIYWKHPGVEGISIVGDEIVDWPEALGPVPDADAIAAIEAEYEAATTKQAATDQINAERDAAIDAGVMYGGSKWDTNQSAREILTGVISAAAAGVQMPATFTWRDFDNVNHTVDIDFLKGLAAAIIVHVNTQYAIAWARKDAL